MAHYIKMTPEKKQLFLDTISHGFSVVKASERCGFRTQTAYQHKEKDKEFSDAWDQAKVEAQQRREDELNQRAFKGEPIPIVYNGKIMMKENKDGTKEPVTLLKKSDTLLMFAMKAEDPEKYKEKSAVEHLGLDGLAKKLKSLQAATDRADRESSKRGDSTKDKRSSSAGDGEV